LPARLPPFQDRIFYRRYCKTLPVHQQIGVVFCRRAIFRLPIPSISVTQDIRVSLCPTRLAFFRFFRLTFALSIAFDGLLLHWREFRRRRFCFNRVTSRVLSSVVDGLRCT